MERNRELVVVRNVKLKDIKEVIEVKGNMQTPRGIMYIDHMIRFHNGALVAYEDAKREKFLWVVEGAN
jgi:hypothetical protein